MRAVFLLMLILPSCTDNQYTVTGKVIDTEESIPVVGARINAKQGERIISATNTTPSGEYVLKITRPSNAPEPVFDLEIIAENYHSTVESDLSPATDLVHVLVPKDTLRELRNGWYCHAVPMKETLRCMPTRKFVAKFEVADRRHWVENRFVDMLEANDIASPNDVLIDCGNGLWTGDTSDVLGIREPDLSPTDMLETDGSATQNILAKCQEQQTGLLEYLGEAGLGTPGYDGSWESTVDATTQQVEDYINQCELGNIHGTVSAAPALGAAARFVAVELGKALAVLGSMASIYSIVEDDDAPNQWEKNNTSTVSVTVGDSTTETTVTSSTQHTETISQNGTVTQTTSSTSSVTTTTKKTDSSGNQRVTGSTTTTTIRVTTTVTLPDGSTETKTSTTTTVTTTREDGSSTTTTTVENPDGTTETTTTSSSSSHPECDNTSCTTTCDEMQTWWSGFKQQCDEVNWQTYQCTSFIALQWANCPDPAYVTPSPEGTYSCSVMTDESAIAEVREEICRGLEVVDWECRVIEGRPNIDFGLSICSDPRVVFADDACILDVPIPRR